jgi:hypothetical protein
VGGVPPTNDNARRAPQKLSGSRDVGFFCTGRMKDRTLVFYKKRDGISSTFKVITVSQNLYPNSLADQNPLTLGPRARLPKILRKEIPLRASAVWENGILQGL